MSDADPIRAVLGALSVLRSLPEFAAAGLAATNFAGEPSCSPRILNASLVAGVCRESRTTLRLTRHEPAVTFASPILAS